MIFLDRPPTPVYFTDPETITNPYQIKPPLISQVSIDKEKTATVRRRSTLCLLNLYRCWCCNTRYLLRRMMMRLHSSLPVSAFPSFTGPGLVPNGSAGDVVCIISCTLFENRSWTGHPYSWHWPTCPAVFQWEVEPVIGPGLPLSVDRIYSQCGHDPRHIGAAALIHRR